MITLSRYNGSDWYFWKKVDWSEYTKTVKAIGSTEGITWKAEF